MGVLAYNAGWKCFGKVTWHWLKLISGTACLCGLKEGLKGLWERREEGEGTRLHCERRRFVKWAELACRREWTWKTETSWGFTLLQSWPWAPHSRYDPLLCYPVLKPATGRETGGQDLIHPSQGNQVGPVVPQWCPRSEPVFLGLDKWDQHLWCDWTVEDWGERSGSVAWIRGSLSRTFTDDPETWNLRFYKSQNE